MRYFSFILFLYLILSIASCQLQNNDSNINSEESLFNEIEGKVSGITFANNLTETNQYNHLFWSNIYNGAGVVAADINNDGLEDFFFCGNQVNDALS